MTNVALTSQYVVDLARRYADDPSNDYPGMPLSTLPFAAKDLLHEAIAEGRVEVVERERHGRTYRYITLTEQAVNRVRLLATMRAFQEAALALDRAWEDEDGGILGDSYGLNLSFDEIAAIIAGWEVPTS